MHSIQLMNWADVCIDLATSVVFEAVRLKKPVLAADYLHAGRSAIAVYMPETELRCRDDVYEKFSDFLPKELRIFISKAIANIFRSNARRWGKDVLAHYIALLESTAKLNEKKTIMAVIPRFHSGVLCLIFKETRCNGLYAQGGQTNVTVRNQPLVISVDHWRVLGRAKNYSIKEPDTLDWLDGFEPGTCYFDIGANIGQFSLYPAKKYGQK